MDRFAVSPAKKAGNRRRHLRFSPLEPAIKLDQRCFEASDSVVTRLSADFLLRGQRSRDPSSQIARLADQFVALNYSAFRQLDLVVESHYRNSTVELEVRAGTCIGAIPLISPTSGRNDYGLVVRPRFDWPGIGPILGATGWRVIPAPLSMPSLPRSERRVPPWVLSTIVLFRLKRLLEQLESRFEIISEDLSSPRGTIDWGRYLSGQITRARFLDVPCRFPVLQKDRDLRAAIRFALEKQVRSLESQRIAGSYVRDLIEMCRDLIGRVSDIGPREPLPTTFQVWQRRTLRTQVFRHGVEAIEWTAEERGLAGLSDLQGLPWAMSMEKFFEAWIETLMSHVVRQIGGELRSGRERETVVPLNWNPPYLGSQKSLIPDLVIVREDTTIIIDAKYKEHWEDMQERRWADLEEELRERHRADLLQVLAYSTVARTPKVLVCLAYPCNEERWISLRARNLLLHRASLPLSERRVELMLVAFPLSTRVISEAVSLMAEEIRRITL
jgi:5-methylcytosine-specific restriction endonuclease McrBC regulatory subunit McrC